METKTKKTDKYCPQLFGGGFLRARVDRLSKRTGRKKYAIVIEALENGLAAMEAGK